MAGITQISSVSDVNRLVQMHTKHPLISFIELDKVENFQMVEGKFLSELFVIMMKEHCQGNLKYGRSKYDFQEGTLVFIAPGQVVEFEQENNGDEANVGWAMFFHPDLISGTSLNSKMGDYSFFNYDSNEALHVSDKEKTTLYNCAKNIEEELVQNIDKHSQLLMVTILELMLNYCQRFYNRQFITRTKPNKDILTRFESILKKTIQTNKLRETGLPTVKQLAEQLHLSSNYLSDLLKKETGKNAQEHIHYSLIETAKDQLLGSGSSISEIAYNLGFEYPQYFSKIFKKKTGMSPAEFRNVN